MHTYKQIVDNQEKYKDAIFAFYSKEIEEAKRTLSSISCEDEFIKKEKEKLLKKFKKVKTISSIKRFFLLNRTDNDKFYVWWDENINEPIILAYGKK
jgi:hypothetical protein